MNLSGFWLMGISMFLYSLCEAFEKYLTKVYEPYQIMFFRSSVGVFIVVWITFTKGFHAYKSNLSWNVLRNIFAGGALFLTIYSLKNLPLSSYEFMTFTSPIFISLLSATFLKEKLSPFIFASLFMSLIGGLTLSYPFSDANLNIGFLLALSSSLLYSSAVVITKRIAHTDYLILYAVYIATCFVMSGAFSYGDIYIHPQDIPFFIILAMTHFVAFRFFILALRKEDLVKLSPLEYTTAVWSIILGYLIWRYVPGFKELTGGILIILGSIAVKHKEFKIFMTNNFKKFLRKTP